MNVRFNCKRGQQNRISLLLAVLLCLTACGTRNDIRKNVEKMSSVPVSIIERDMDCWIPDSSQFPISDAKKDYTMVIYADSTQCTPCFVNKLTNWNEFVSFENNGNYSVRFIFILETLPGLADIAIKNLAKSAFQHPVFIDTKCSFRKENPHIPEGVMYHTFLLDKENKVIMVGNPCTSKDIKELFVKCINGQYEQNTKH